MSTITLAIYDPNDNLVMGKDLCKGDVVPMHPIPDRGEVKLVFTEEMVNKVIKKLFGNVPYCMSGHTTYRGDMAVFIYNNLRGKRLA